MKSLSGSRAVSLVLIGLLLPSLAGCGTRNSMTPSGDTRAAIDAANENVMTNFGNQDAAGIAKLYTDNGQLLPANSGVVAGTARIQAFWQGAFDMGLRELVLETVELKDHGETAIEVGRYTLKADGGAVADKGKYIVVWKNDGGTWKLHRDIWTTSGTTLGLAPTWQPT